MSVFRLFFLSFITLVVTTSFSLAQFVETPEVVLKENAPAVESASNIANVFEVLILVCALLFIISIFGFIIGFTRLITAGGNEITAEKSKDVMVISGWIFAASILGYLLINIVKYFIY